MLSSSFHHQINFEKQAAREEPFLILSMRKLGPSERGHVAQMAGSKHQPQTALFFNTKFIALSATVKMLSSSGYVKPRSPSLLRGITRMFQNQTPEPKSILLPFFFFSLGSILRSSQKSTEMKTPLSFPKPVS